MSGSYEHALLALDPVPEPGQVHGPGEALALLGLELHLEHDARAASARGAWGIRTGKRSSHARDVRMLTPTAWAASACRSSGSDVSAVPSGSAMATTRASTAEPVFARRRS